MEFATIVETAMAVGPELIVLFLVLIGLYNKNALITAKRLLKEDPAGKALNIIEKADVNELSRVLDRLDNQIKVLEAKQEEAAQPQINEIYKGVEAAVKKKNLEK
jgi:hypothetical protein